MQPALIALYHKQPTTPLKIYNSETEGFVNSGMKFKRLKTWDMKWHGLSDREVPEKLLVY